LLDLSLPDKKGHELVTEMLKLAPVCPVIILTGYADVDFSINSIAKGISDYLLKDDLNSTSLYKSIVYCIERRKQVLELKQSEKRYSTLFLQSPQPMWVYDPETSRFVQANKAATEHYGYSEMEFLEMPAKMIRIGDERRNGKVSGDDLTVRKENNLKGRFRHIKKTGELIDVDIYSTPIVINDRHYLSVIAIDVTEKILFEYKITRAIIKTQEDERYEIGAELHDNVCQILASSLMTLGMLRKLLDSSCIDLFEKSKEHILLATVEIRNLSHRLAPAFFNNSTLEEAFTMLLNTFNQEKKFEIITCFDKASGTVSIDREMKLNLYRLLQEQLSNILKYAKATRINVDVLIHKKFLKMKVTDNGVGFDIHKVKRGIGLSNMKRRTELFSGSLFIESSPGNGCETIIEMPLHKATRSQQEIVFP